MSISRLLQTNSEHPSTLSQLKTIANQIDSFKKLFCDGMDPSLSETMIPAAMLVISLWKTLRETLKALEDSYHFRKDYHPKGTGGDFAMNSSLHAFVNEKHLSNSVDMQRAIVLPHSSYSVHVNLGETQAIEWRYKAGNDDSQSRFCAAYCVDDNKTNEYIKCKFHHGYNDDIPGRGTFAPSLQCKMKLEWMNTSPTNVLLLDYTINLIKSRGKTGQASPNVEHQRSKEEIITAMDPYDVLEVASDASPEEIKKAYRRLLLVCHPDKEGKKQNFLVLQQAYDLLRDPSKRAQYDLQRGSEVIEKLQAKWRNSPAYESKQL